MKQLKKIVYLVVFSGLLWSCGSSKPAYSKAPSKPSSSKANLRNLTSSAYSKPSSEVKNNKRCRRLFRHTVSIRRYYQKRFWLQWFGYHRFSENNYKLPRRSEDQAKEGKNRNSRSKTRRFTVFATSGAAKINHVGIVNGISSGGEVTFIHASTSKGVIISSLNDAYWNKAFLFARRVL